MVSGLAAIIAISRNTQASDSYRMQFNEQELYLKRQTVEALTQSILRFI